MNRPRSLTTLAAIGTLTLTALAGCGGSTPAANTSSSGSGATSGTSGASGSSGSASSASTTASTTAAPTTTAATGTTSTSSSGGATAGGGACTAPRLALSYLGSQGAAGHAVLGFELRNTSSRPCRTYGYPGVQFLTADGQDLTTRPTRTTTDLMGTTKLEHLVLAPGEGASFRLTVSHVANSPTACVTAHGLQVIPPDDTQSLKTAIPGGADECDGDVTVSPLQAGNSAYAAGGQ